MNQAMLIIGGQPGTIREARDAIVEVLKAAGTEAASVAAMHTLAELARAPTHTNISGCSFESNPKPMKRRK